MKIGELNEIVQETTSVTRLYLVRFNDFVDLDVDHWFGNFGNICVSVNIEPDLRFLHFTNQLEIFPENWEERGYLTEN